MRPAALVLLAGLAFLPPAVADEGCVHLVLDRDKASGGDFTATHLAEQDLVTVLEVAGNYDRNLPDGSFNDVPRQVVAQEFYAHHTDEYDFLVAFTNFEFATGQARAFFSGVQNTDSGIGLPLFDNSDLFGSAGRLQGYVDLAAVSRAVLEPNDPAFEELLVTLSHELLHRWAARVRFREPGGAPSAALLGRDGSHWSYLLDSDASVMYGSDWRDNGDGTFTSTATLKFWSPLDLYLAGFYGPDEVPPLTLLEAPGVDVGQLPQVGATVTATTRQVRIEDIVAAEGPRLPAAGEGQREFRLGFVFLTRPGSLVDSRAIAGINRLRREIATRFAILTGGRGLLHPYPQVVPGGVPGAPEPVGGGPLRPGEANLLDALAWLRSRQAGEGFWEDRPATRTRDTAVALTTLARLDPFFGGVAPAVSWLAGQPAANVDFAARAASVLGGLGEEALALRQALLPWQNADGGWGVGPGFASDPLDTALAVLALDGDPADAEPGASAAVSRAVAYLAAAQNADGGFSQSRGGASRTGVTAVALRALDAAGAASGPAPAALAWLASRQNPDGGFGDSPSTVHDTAAAMDALITLGAPGSARLGEAATFLAGRQSLDGSWAGSVYATSLAVSALKRFSFANLRFTAPPTADPPNPGEGERVQLAYTVGNDGNATAPATALRVYRGDPSAGGVPIGPDVALPPLPAGASATVGLLWDTTGVAGPTELIAVLDPEGTLDELSELDNRAALPVEVREAPLDPDLEVRGTDLLITPAQPAALPSTLGITATVRNLGRTAVPAVNVRLFATAPGAAAEVVGEQTVAVADRSSVAVSFTYVLTTAGATDLTVVVDPEGAVAEANEANNTASRTVSTAASVDLGVAAADLELLGAPYLGSDVRFRVRLENHGTLESPDAQVRYSVTDGVAVRVLANNTVRIAGGGSTLQEITWRVDLSGAVSFRVEIDPDSLVPESEEGNNTAELAFTAGALDQPNLALSFADFTFDPNPGREGKPLTLSARVRNNGGAPVSDVEVAFYDGDPATGAPQILERAVIPALGAGEQAVASLVWPRLPTAADRLLYAVVDPDGEIAEFSEEDNTAFNVLAVLSLPDLGISPASLALAPRFPRPGDAVSLTVTVANLGEQEVRDLVVRAFDGEPSAGGTPVAPDQVIALVPGNGTAQAVFAWTFAASGGSRPVVVQIDPEGTEEESSEANNQARLEVAIQEGDFFLSERYFSPNGDLIQDETELFFRLDEPVTGEIEIVDAVRDQVVRREPLAGVDAGNFVWDGRDDQGRLARDADYVLRVVDGAGNVLGSAPATLDTNRISLLLAAGTGAELFNNLTCELPSISTPLPTQDDGWLYFYIRAAGDPVYSRGVYRLRPDGGDLEQILPAPFFGLFEPFELVISPDGGRIAVLKLRFLFSTVIRELWVANGDGSARLRLATRPDGTTDDSPIGFSADGRVLYVDRLGSIVAIPLNGVDPQRVLWTGFTAHDFAFSPDRRRLAFRTGGGFDETGYAVHLLNLDSGAETELTTGSLQPQYAWAPTGDRLAVSDPDAGRVLVVDGAGVTVRAFELEAVLYPWPDEIPDLAPERGFAWQLAWARGGTELAATIGYGSSCASDFSVFFRVARLDLLTGEQETIAWTKPFGEEGCQSYHVSTWDGSSWAERGVLHHGLRYREQTLDLSPFLPDAEGDYKVRIRQTGMEAAHVESVALLAGGSRLAPAAAVHLGTGQDLASVVSTSDGDVADLHESTLEVEWAEVPPGRLRLALKAREETLSDRDARPFRYPAEEGAFYSLLLDGSSPMVVDGQQTGQDGLTEPLFEVRSRPDTGHPAATVAGYAGSDGQSLFVALDFTVDNTRDGEADWAALWVRAADGWRELRVTEGDATHGAVGFTRTGRVHHQHKYYELRVPLAELGAAAGDTVDLYLQAYGTAAELPEEDDGRLPQGGSLLWDPNDRALLWTSAGDGEPAWAIFLDEDGRRASLFDDFTAVGGERFSPTGRRLLFLSNDQRNDPASPCYQRGNEDHWQMRSLLNLTVDLRPRRVSVSGGVLVEGTAADQHFDQYRLEWATSATPTDFRPITPPSPTPVVDQRFTTWVPPGPGSYLVRLTATDLAGNSLARIKRVSFADTPSLTDVYMEPRYISPNGDGVREAATVSYRVLEPVHLEFGFENEAGERVRTILRDHSQIGAEHSFLWDGRDDRGLPVPDGEYRLVVQSFEFFVTVDSTPPVLRMALRNARQCRGGKVVAEPTVLFGIWEDNFDSTEGSTGEGADLFVWAPFYLPAVPLDPTASVPPEIADPALGRPDLIGGRGLALSEFVDHRFRVEVEDLAGNRSLVATPLGSEELFLTHFGNPYEDPITHVVAPPALACSKPAAQLDLAQPVEARAAESVVSGLFELYLEIQPMPIVDGTPHPELLAPEAWFSSRVTQFLISGGTTASIPQHFFRFLWDKAGLEPGRLTALRLRAVDDDGDTHLSQLVSVSSEGLAFLGVSPPDAVLAGSLIEGLDPALAGQLKLWGIESVAQPFAEATLYLSSPDDPRYATPKAIPAAVIRDGGFLFTAADWQACKRYEGYFVATTVPAFNPLTGRIESRTFTSNRRDFKFPCLAVTMAIGNLVSGACNQPPPLQRRTLTVHPRSLDGTALQLLSVFGPGEAGEQDLLTTVNNPTSGQQYSFELDLEDLPAGLHPFGVRLTNVNGEVVEWGAFVDAATGTVREVPPPHPGLRGPFYALRDRTPPVAELTYPADGQRLCGVERDGVNVVDIEGRAVDPQGVAFLLELGEGLEPVSWEPFGGGIRPNEAGELIVPPLFSSEGETGVLSSLRGRVGDFSIRLSAVNAAGALVCTPPRSFYFDGVFEGASIAKDLSLFSPNGDGILDEVNVLVGALEPATVDFFVRPAVPALTPTGCADTGDPVRDLASGLPILDTGQVSWDGKNDSGAVVADGLYHVHARFEDACGNETDLKVCVDVDTTPPQVAIDFPTATSPLPAIVEVTGTAIDDHFQGWSLEYGVGPDPETWALIETLDQARFQELLAPWNTIGLDGDFTLRLTGVDVLGNRAEARVPLFISQPAVVLEYLEAVPRPFSPNGDGRRETLAVRLGLGSPALLDLTVLDLDGNEVRRLLDDATLPAGAQEVPWDGTHDGGAPAADGLYRIEVYARLAANPGVTQREAVTALLDRTAPAVAFTRPLANQVLPATGGITGSITDLDLASFAVSFTAEPQAPAWEEIASGETNRVDFTFAPLTGLEDGDYALRVEAEDAAEIQTEVLIPFIIDSTPPVVQLTAPAAGSVLSARQPVPVTGAIEEANLLSWTLELGAGAAPASWTGLALGATLPLPEPLLGWNLIGLADGLYTLRLTGLDKAGHSRSAQVAVEIDNTPPTAAISQPANGGYMAGPGEIRGTATDLHFVDYQLAIAPGPAGSSQQFSELGSRAASVADGTLLDWLALPADGLYTLRLTVSDAAGNQSVVLSEVTVDTLPPEPPIALTAEVENRRDAHLSWTPSAAADVAGYAVLRNGVRVNAALVAGTTYVDAGLLEGGYTYVVRAVDRAGHSSEPSNEAPVRIDITPPLADLQVPADGGRASGVVDVRGTAWSPDDFAEYRLYAERPGLPGRELLRRSPVPVTSDVLAQWNTFVLPEGAAFVLTLEAEDLAGNVATDAVQVTIDNLPPAAPTGLTATTSGTTINVSWNANTEPDLRGYLLYRDGRLVNAPGPVVGSLLPYVLTATTYADTGRPDGTFTYQVYAMDLAENLSDPSAPASATVETGAPRAVITTPAHGSSFEAELYIQATSEDSDVARVQFQYRPSAGGAWINLGAADLELPWETIWTPALPFGDYQLRAVATDSGNRTDPAPPAITVTLTDLTRPPAVLGLAAQVAAGDVTLTWTASTEPDLVGYHLDRRTADQDPVRITAAPVTGTSFLDAGLADATFLYSVVAVDEVENESDPSDEAEAVVYTPLLVQPFTPTAAPATDLEGSGSSGTTAEGEIGGPGGTAPLPPVASDAEGAFHFTAIPLARGESLLSVRQRDAAGNLSKTAQVYVVSDEPPAPPTGLTATPGAGLSVDLAWNANPEPDVVAYRLLRGGAAQPPAEALASLTATASSEGGEYASAEKAVDGDLESGWSPEYDGSALGEWLELAWPQPALVTRVELTWFFYPQPEGPPYVLTPGSFDLEGWDGRVWVPLARVRGDGSPTFTLVPPRPYWTDRVRIVVRGELEFPSLAEVAVFHLPVSAATATTDTPQDGRYEYRVVAVDGYGLESSPSAPAAVDVGDVVPPEPVTLSAVVTGSNVALTWTASASPDVVRYDLFRDEAKIAELPSLEHLDAGRPNGTYRYVVVAVDAAGNASLPSNEAVAVVAVAPPPAPVSLAVTALAEGGALQATWAPGPGPAPAGYRLQRGLAAGGPYQPVVTTNALAYVDRGLTDGVTYFYVVVALDGAGNPSAVSNEASGTPGDAAAPAAPVIFDPAFPGRPFTTEAASVPVAGAAEPGSRVRLRRGGSIVAEAEARSESALERGEFSPDAARTRYSPDGRWAWGEGFPAELHDLLAHTTVEVPAAPGAARWLPDSSGLVVLANGAIRRYRLADGSATEIATLDYAFAAVPAPDGRRLAVLGFREGEFALWLFDPTAASWTRLAPFSDFEIDADSLVFSPRGDALAYRRAEPAPAIELLRLPSAEVAVVEAEAGAAWPRFSPSGGELLYTSTASGDEQVRSYRLADGAITDLTSGPAAHRDPHWSADGRAVGFVVDDAGVFVAPLAGGEPLQLLDLAAGPYAGFFARLDSVASGFWLVQVAGEVLRIEPAGRFLAPSVALVPGTNTLTATATDAAGNVSPASEPVEIQLVVSNRPNLGVTETDLAVLPEAVVVGATAQLSVTVRNTGAAASPQADLSIVVFGPQGLFAEVVSGPELPAIPAGGSVTISRPLVLDGEPGSYSLIAAADPLAALPEVSETDNRAERAFLVGEPGRPGVAVATDRQQYLSGQAVEASVEVVNFGDAFTGTLEVVVEDAQGFLVADLLTQPITALPFAGRLSFTPTWPTGDTFAGGYRVRARLTSAAGAPVDEALAPFAIVELVQLAARVETDRASYPRGSTVRVSGSVEYVAGNTAVSGAEARVTILDAGGGLVAELAQALGDLLPSQVGTVRFDWPSGAAPAGTYRVRFAVERGGETAAEAGTLFELFAAQPPAVAGTLSLTDLTPALGVPLDVAYRVTATQTLPGTPIRVTLREPASGAVRASRELIADLGPATPAEGTLSFATAELGLGSFIAVLEATFSTGGGAPAPHLLDAVSFTTFDRTPPVVTVAVPAEGALLGAGGEVVATAFDALSLVARAEVSIDGGDWLALEPGDGAEGQWRRLLAGLAEGEHLGLARATDAWGNTGTSAPRGFTADLTPPVIAITGVEEGGSYEPGVVPVITVTDAHPGPVSIGLDGVLFVSGTPVEEGGEHLLRVVATDAAGNRAERELAFTVAGGEPALAATKTAALAADPDEDGVSSPGDELAYTITLTNTGDAAATGVILTDPAPAHTAVVAGSVEASQGTVVSESPVEVALGELAAGAAATVSFRVAIASPLPAGVSQVSNQGSVTSAELPAVLTDDPAVGGTADATVTVVVVAAPRIAAEKVDALVVDADADGLPSPGDTLEYTVTIRNTGNTPATGVTFDDPVPQRTTLVAGSISTTQGTVTGESPVAVEIGELAPGTPVEVRFRVRLDAAFPPTISEVANQGTVDCAELESVLTDDPAAGGTADPTVTVVKSAARLRVEKRDSLVEDLDGDGVASPGDAVLYQIVVANDGNAGAAEVAITDPAPADTSVVPGSLQTSQGTVVSESPVEVALGELAAGASATASFRVRIDAGLPYTVTAIANQATVEAAGLAAVASDDPATPAAADPTVTLVLITPAISIADAAAGESAAAITFTVSLSRAGNREVSVAFATADLTATAGADYTAASGTLAFAAGETSKTVTVGLLGDATDEPDETFRATLSAPVNATLADAEATGTIADDEVTAVFCPKSPGYWKTHPSAWPAQQLVLGGVTYNASQLSTFLGYGGSDAATKLARQLVATKFNLLAGSSPSIQPVVAQADSFLAAHPPGSNPTGSARTQANNLKAQLEAYNTGGCQVTVAIADASVEEGHGDPPPAEAVLTVSLSAPIDEDLTVSFATADGTALAGQDYVQKSGQVTVPAGAATAELRVTVSGDVVLEGDETFRVTLSNPSRGTLADGEATVTVVDDESCAGPNLLANAGAEAALSGGEVPGWDEVQSSSWQRRGGDDPAAVEGGYSFFAGEVPEAELAQDVSLAAYEEAIAAGGQRFAFRGFVRTRDEVPADAARLVLEYRDQANAAVLASFDSGELAAAEEWLEVSDVREAPAGTGWVRVRLIAVRYGEEGAADAYFDGFELFSLDTPVLVVGDTLAHEPEAGGETEASFELRLSCASPQPVTVVTSTADGTATAGSDYQAALEVTQTIAARESSKAVPITVLGDAVTEGDEHFALEIESAEGAVVHDREGLALIVEELASETCPRSPGYWKNHQSEWPAEELLIGGVTYDAEAIAALLDYGGPDAATKLARQLVATRFNLLAGADPFIAPSAAAADDFLAAFPPGSHPQGPDRDRAESLADALEGYNTLECGGGGGCSATPLGLAGGFNVFVFGNLAQNGSDTEGRMAAGGSVQLNSYSVGELEPNPPGAQDVLVAGGHLSFANGTVRGGDVVYGLTQQILNVNVPDGVVRQGAPIDFAAERTAQQARSASLAALAANGSTQVTPWGAITLTGTDPVRNVFTLTTAQLQTASSFTIQAPAGSSVVVNLAGTSAAMQNFGFSLSGPARERVLFNFHQATSLQMSSIGVEGSILAPYAAVQFNNGVIHGSLVAASLQGNGQSNRRPFEGCLP